MEPFGARKRMIFNTEKWRNDWLQSMKLNTEFVTVFFFVDSIHNKIRLIALTNTIPQFQKLKIEMREWCKKSPFFTPYWFEDNIHTTKPLYGYATMLFCSSKKNVHFSCTLCFLLLNFNIESWKKKREKRRRNQKSTHVSPNYFPKTKNRDSPNFHFGLLSKFSQLPNRTQCLRDWTILQAMELNKTKQKKNRQTNKQKVLMVHLVSRIHSSLSNSAY